MIFRLGKKLSDTKKVICKIKNIIGLHSNLSLLFCESHYLGTKDKSLTGKNIFKLHIWKMIYIRLYKKVLKFTNNKTNKPIKNWANIQTDISAKKVGEWQIDMGKDAQHH